MCAQSADARSMTVPADVLSILPASNPDSTTLPGILEVGTMTRTDAGRFTAGGLAGGYFQARRTTRILATYQ